VELMGYFANQLEGLLKYVLENKKEVFVTCKKLDKLIK